MADPTIADLCERLRFAAENDPHAGVILRETMRRAADLLELRKPDLSGCEVMEDGKGITLESEKPFNFTCCDCGLTHRCVIVSEDGRPVGFAVERAGNAGVDLRDGEKR